MTSTLVSNTEIAEAVEQRRNFAIISHPDAGKTTLTEKLLLYGGAIHEAGAVKARRAQRHAVSDWMALEQQRGISITSTVLQFSYDDYWINLLDTPGHQDFSEDTYRTLAAADNAVMLEDAAKGLEPQTRKLFEVCKMRGLPIFTFFNKLDRPGQEPLALLDEIEKAHPDIFNMLLQMLDDGHVTDAKGRKVDFKNTLIILTSNIGSRVIEKGGGGLGFDLEDEAEASYNRIKTLVNEELKNYFRPEFLNRLDEIIVFTQLQKDEIKEIADILLKEVSKRLAEKEISLQIGEGFRELVVQEGYDPSYGARPLRRAIMNLLEDSLAEAMLSGQICQGDTAVVDVDDDGKVRVTKSEKSELELASIS